MVEKHLSTVLAWFITAFVFVVVSMIAKGVWNLIKKVYAKRKPKLVVVEGK